VRSCSDVHNFLLEEGVAHEVLHLPRLSATAQRAADLLGVPVAEVVKSLVFILDGAATLIVVPGDATVDVDLVRTSVGCEEAALAHAPEVLELTGYRAGAVPPCGLASDLPVIADPRVFAPPVVYCGGGTTTTMLKIRSDDLRRVLQPRVLAVASRRGESHRGR
jgi:prolyl-tRNA editing enzyme YbaK/EbsC (Cys-tRNA(Pro) deacylase)